MSAELDRLAYLLRCENEVQRLIVEAQRERFLTPTQVERVRRWRRVRRALAHDLMQHMMTMHERVQLRFDVRIEDEEIVTEWRIRQAREFRTDSATDPLNEGVENARRFPAGG